MLEEMPDPSAESPVLAGLDQMPTAVSRKDSPWGTIIGVGALACVGWVVFSGLSHDRQANAQSTRPAPAVAQPTVSAAPMAMLNPPINTAQASAAAPPPPVSYEPNPDRVAALKSPAMIVDIADDNEGASGGSALAPGSVSSPAARAQAQALAQQAADNNRLSADERFADGVASASVGTTRATRLKDTALIAPQGTVIPAVLETAINLDLPGYARAVVTRDVRGFDGSTVLIPRGSHLIGQYRAGAAAGQARAFVVWSRVLTPEGVSVDIGSPGADQLGQAGLPGETNTHFFRRFGSSILLSVLTTGLEALVPNSTNNAAIVIGSQQQASNIAAIALQKQIDIPDTVTVAQGAAIRVFVARDLDFSAVATRKP